MKVDTSFDVSTYLFKFYKKRDRYMKKMNETEKVKGKIAKEVWRIITSDKAKKYFSAEEPFFFNEEGKICASDLAHTILSMNKSLEDDGITTFSSSDLVMMCRAYMNSSTYKNAQVKQTIREIEAYFYGETGELYTCVKDDEWIYPNFDHMIRAYNKLKGSDLWEPIME